MEKITTIFKGWKPLIKIKESVAQYTLKHADIWSCLNDSNMLRHENEMYQKINWTD